MLPPDERIHGVAPGPALYAAPVPAEVARVPHLGEDGRGLSVVVGPGAVPGLTRQPALGGVDLALVIPPSTRDTRGCIESVNIIDSIFVAGAVHK